VNAAIFRKTFRDSALVLSIATLALVVFNAIFVFIADITLAEMPDYLTRLRPIFQKLISGLVGGNISLKIDMMGFLAVAYVHPFLQMVMWAFVITITSRVIAGEIDSGTADLLFSLPVRRSTIFVTTSAVWMLCGAILCAAPLAGTWIGTKFLEPRPTGVTTNETPDPTPATATAGGADAVGPMRIPFLSPTPTPTPQRQPVQYGMLVKICVNLFALYVAIGSGGMMLSTILSRRVQAVGILTGVVLTSFVINFLAVFWETLSPLGYLSFLNYYTPMNVVMNGDWPLKDITILTGGAAAALLTGWIVCVRRDIAG
jgi:ABC-type transport system involved in multi-copper enzyme maturation permease subunit